MNLTPEATQIPLAVAAAVYLAKVAIETGAKVKGKANGGTYEDKVIRELRRIADGNADHRNQVAELRRESREAHAEARETTRAIGVAVQALTTVVDRSGAAIEAQNKIMERMIDHAFPPPGGPQ